MPDTLLPLKERVQAQALRLGFSSVRVADASALEHRRPELAVWIEKGRAGPLKFMQDFFGRQKRFLSRLPDIKSILMLAAPYAAKSPSELSPGHGRIARYAVGKDYHDWIGARLKELTDFIRSQTDEPVHVWTAVDTSPIQEKALAEASGVGFIGKNTCLIHPKQGSYLFLAALLTDLKIQPDPALDWNCGNCTLCVQACPTQALVKPYELDANRCIATLTIEQRGPIDPELRSKIGEWLFGCDICQQVCPYNRAEKHSGTEAAQLPLEPLLRLRSESQFKTEYGPTPLSRPRREGLVRNAALVAGNRREAALVPALASALKEDPSPLVRGHAAWSLGRISTDRATEALQEALKSEQDPEVRREISQALQV